jgi:hypothetical protein
VCLPLTLCLGCMLLCNATYIANVISLYLYLSSIRPSKVRIWTRTISCGGRFPSTGRRRGWTPTTWLSGSIRRVPLCQSTAPGTVTERAREREREKAPASTRAYQDLQTQTHTHAFSLTHTHMHLYRESHTHSLFDLPTTLVHTHNIFTWLTGCGLVWLVGIRLSYSRH